jgi:hypothetical protein
MSEILGKNWAGLLLGVAGDQKKEATGTGVY